MLAERNEKKKKKKKKKQGGKALKRSPPITTYRKNSHPLTIASSILRGRTIMTLRSCLLNPSAVAGRPSVTKFTHRSWTCSKEIQIPLTLWYTRSKLQLDPTNISKKYTSEMCTRCWSTIIIAYEFLK
jgi:hypothetical protein